MNTRNGYDAIVVGARCAGSPTAMLLARKGYKVLLLDRATFPSDTISTHLIHPPGVAALQRWGLLDRVLSTGCPPINTYAFDMGPFTISGSPGTDASPVSYGPRRTVLDKLLVDAAAEAGAEVRTGFTVDEVLLEDGVVTAVRGHAKDGAPVVERARVVVGADGIHSIVARTVAAEQYHDRPQLEAGYYSYWSGLPMNGQFEAYDRGDRVWAVWPTNDNLTLVIVCWPYAEFETDKTDVEAHYMKAFERAPAFAGTHARRQAGGALPRRGRAELLPQAVWSGLGSGRRRRLQQGLHHGPGNFGRLPRRRTVRQRYRRIILRRSYLRCRNDGVPITRDEHVLPMYKFTCQFASFTPPTPEMQQLFGAMLGNQTAMDGFARVIAGVTSPAEFFSD